MEQTHSAEAAALGFYYQAFFALHTLIALKTDNAAIGIEQLDDVELKADGQTLLYQLKHSISTTPPVLTLKSRALWRTIKLWVDVMPTLTLSETTLHLVTAGNIADDSPLQALTGADNTDIARAELTLAMTSEAQRVVDARIAAAKGKKQLPYADRADGCEAFLSLSEIERLNLIRRALIKQNSPTIIEVEERITEHLDILPRDQRPTVAKRLVEWWDRQVVYSLCGKRERIITRAELQDQIMAIIGDIEEGKLMPDFELVSPPEDYQPDGMLARQIHLVDGKSSDLARAIREEWRAREQRSRWLNANPAMASTINDYDFVLKEQWSDRHSQMAEACAQFGEKDKCAFGLQVLRWTHNDAPTVVRPIANGWNAAYYVRGSYQVLAINLTVGWHPEYAHRLRGNT